MRSYILIKKAFDIFFSIFILITSSPLLILIMIGIKLTSKGPIFYLHKRVSNNKTFNCIKFRTMYTNSDKALEKLLKDDVNLTKEFKENFKIRKDPRVTPFGKILRKTSLDEFPQFINVIKGEMSIIGPRPIVEEEKKRYGKQVDNLLLVKPGITGLWQVKGRSKLSYKDRKKLDIYYVKNISIFLDIYIFLKTIIVILFPFNKGAF